MQLSRSSTRKSLERSIESLEKLFTNSKLQCILRASLGLEASGRRPMIIPCRLQKHVGHMQFVLDSKRGLGRELRPGPLAPRERIIPLHHTAGDMTKFGPKGFCTVPQVPKPSFSSDSTHVVLGALDARSPIHFAAQMVYQFKTHVLSL